MFHTRRITIDKKVTKNGIQWISVSRIFSCGNLDERLKCFLITHYFKAVDTT